MYLIGLMLARNEGWIIEASLKAACQWVDGLAIFLDRCTDNTLDIVRRVAKTCGKDIMVSTSDEGEHWDEMHIRQKNLEDGRSMGGTHFAIIDCDEILTANHLDSVRGWFEKLEPGQVLDVPMIAPWCSLDLYSPHTKGIITIGFRDKEGLGWAPRGEEQYHHHSRPPHGHTSRLMQEVESGGVMHLQWVSMRRVKAKHAAYVMMECVRWNYPEAELNDKYTWWCKPPHGTDLKPVPAEWWGEYDKRAINLHHVPWYEWEIKKLMREHGEDRFSKLELFGYAPVSH